MTSLLLLVVAILAIAASVFMFVRYRESRRELEDLRKGGPGGRRERTEGFGPPLSSFPFFSPRSADASLI